MTSKEISNGILRALGTVVLIVIIGYLLYKIQSVIVYLGIAIVLSLIATPILRFLQNKLKMSKILSVILVMILFILAIAGIISMFVPLIIQQGHHLSLLNTEELAKDVMDLSKELSNSGFTNDFDLTQEIEKFDFKTVIHSISGLFNKLISAVGSFSIGLFSVLFITFFLMKDNNILYNAFLAITPDEKEERILKSLYKIKILLSRYFIGLIVQVSILFVIYSLVLLIFGVESAIVIAFLCALLNLIPYIGPLIGGALMIMLTMTSNLEQDFKTYVLPTTLYVFIGYVIAQLIDNFFSQPIIFSKSVKSHPLEIFLIIIIGGLLFGITGMILAVPIYTALKVILKEFLADNEIVKNLTRDLDIE